MKLDKIYPELAARNTFTKKDMDWLCALFYDIYLEGIEEGKNQVKDKMIENLLLLMDTDK